MKYFLVQNPDRNVSVKDYEKFGSDVLLVTNIFRTIQGEGPFAGRPAVFIRLAGCNKGDKKACEFCDTYFAYAAGKPMTVDQIDARIQELCGITCYSHLIVITGGEPMMQDNLARLVEHLCSLHYDVQIETNGDRLVADLHNDCNIVISPKINPSSKQYMPLANAYRSRARGIVAPVYLKFVVDHRFESPYNKLPEYAFSLAGFAGVFVSPLTVYKEAVILGTVPSAWNRDLINLELTRMNYRYAADLAIRYNFRVSMQSHLFYELE